MNEKKQIHRRELLRLAGCSLAGAALPPWLTWPAPSPVAVLQGTGLSLPCAAGDVSADGAVVWLRGERESLVELEYGKEPALRDALRTAPLRLSKGGDYTGKVVLYGLDPQTTYYYRAHVAGRRPGPVARFATAPRPDRLTGVRFAFGGDTRQRFRPFRIMNAIRDKQPDFFLHLGDTIYADLDGRARELQQFREKHANNRRDEPTQRLFAETSIYATWDDHEVADDYGGAHPLAPMGQRAFREYWPIRPDPAEPQRIYRSARWGKAAELFILDTRQYRDRAAGTLLGVRQRQWLLDMLGNSDAHFKFICTSVPFTSPNSDKWGGYPAEREALLRTIRDKKIGGVVFLAADLHYAAVVPVAEYAALKEIVVGPLGAKMGPRRGPEDDFEFFNNKHLNYGLATIGVEGGRARAQIEIFTAKNILLYKLDIGSNPLE